MFKQTSNGTSGSASHDVLAYWSHRRSGIARILFEFIFITAVACLAGPAWGQTGTSIEITRDGSDPSLAGQGVVVFTHLDFGGIAPAPTGDITITDGTDSCTATLPETFCLYQPQSPGTKTLTASYSGDANFDSSVSAAVSHVVEPQALPERVSVPDGYALFGPVVRQTNNVSQSASVSADGRFVAFHSDADNLVPDDFNGTTDVFVHDRLSGSVVRISTDFFGNDGNGASENPKISADGQAVVFQSEADNLVFGDTNGRSDIFYHDRQTGFTSRVSVDSSGVEGNSGSVNPSISQHGQFVAFESDADNLVPNDTNNRQDIFVREVFNDTTVRVSIDSNDNQANEFSGFASISADGLSVAFESFATNLVPGDNNGVSDVFVRDLDTGFTERVSIADDGSESDDFSSSGGTLANISSDGQRVVFESNATNLVTGDDNSARDIFVRDRDADSTIRVSVDSDGIQSNLSSENPAISAGGGFVAFVSDANNLVENDDNGVGDVFTHEIGTGTTERASVNSANFEGNLASTLPALSGNGAFVVFESYAPNLVGGDTNGTRDIFVRDRGSQTTVRASIAAQGTQGNGDVLNPAVSENGQFVAFASRAGNLVPGDDNADPDIFVVDRGTGAVERISVNDDGVGANSSSFEPSISDDGRLVAFVSDADNLVAGDTGFRDIFVRDRDLGTTERVSVDSSEVQADGDSHQPAISGDGRFVAFISTATNLVDVDTNGVFDVFVRDRDSGTTERVSVDSAEVGADDESFSPSISDDGQFVAFESPATNLVGSDTNGAPDIFVRDRGAGTTERVSVQSVTGDEGTGGNQGANRPSISGNGRLVAFEAEFDNLVNGDTNGIDDVFVHDRDTGETERVSLDDAGSEVDGFSNAPSISDTGRFVAFESVQPDLDTDAESNGFISDIFVHDRETGNVRLMSANRDDEATNAGSFNAAISADGRIVAFESLATNLVPGDGNQSRDAFVASNPFETDLVIDKTSGSFFTPPGGTLTYTVNIINQGPLDAQGAIVEDMPPPRLGNLTWTCSAQGDADCPGSGTGDIDTVVDIPAGDSVTFTLEATLQDTNEIPVTNTAMVMPPAGIEELDAGDNVDSDTDLVAVFASGFETVEPD